MHATAARASVLHTAAALLVMLQASGRPPPSHVSQPPYIFIFITQDYTADIPTQSPLLPVSVADAPLPNLQAASQATGVSLIQLRMAQHIPPPLPPCTLSCGLCTTREGGLRRRPLICPGLGSVRSNAA
jgi:hypothetical protein